MILRPYCSYLTIENIWNYSIILLIFGNGNHFNIYDLMYELKRLMQWKLIDSLKICHQTSPQIMSSSDQNTVIYILILLLWRSSRYNQQPEGKKRWEYTVSTDNSFHLERICELLFMFDFAIQPRRSSVWWWRSSQVLHSINKDSSIFPYSYCQTLPHSQEGWCMAIILILLIV